MFNDIFGVINLSSLISPLSCFSQGEDQHTVSSIFEISLKHECQGMLQFFEMY